ncbi:MAG TPA: TfoX/Sxy family protein [Chloroflexota bacterium]
MAWKKTSPEMIAFMDSATADLPCSRKLMFGGVAYFANGNMFAGVHQDTPFIRLSEPDREALTARWDEASPFEPMEGRPMREYVLLPEALYSDSGTLREWIERSLGYASALVPGKAGKKARS